MELDKNEFKDNVVYDLINFISLKKDSDKDLEMWHSTLDSGTHCKTYLYQLFDDSECLHFIKYAEENCFVNIDNEKLLRISSISPMYDRFGRTFFVFALYNNISDIKVLYEQNGSIEITNGNNSLLFKPIDSLNRTKEDFVTNEIMKLIKPVSLEELIEKGKKGRRK